MRQSYCIASLVIALVCSYSSSGEDNTPTENPLTERQCILDSGIVTVRSSRKTDEVRVSWQGFDGENRGTAIVDIIKGRDVELETFEISRWFSASLIVAFRIRSENGWDYGVSTISRASLRLGQDAIGSRSHIFARMSEKYRIAAVDGTYEGDSISVILAKHESDKSGQRPIGKMVSFTHVCPNPDLTDGVVREFVAGRERE